MQTRARQDRRTRLWLTATAGVLVFACAPLLAPPEPTLDPRSVNTLIAETAAAAQTRTAVFTPPTWTPSFTPFPTHTASITPTPSETFVFALPTFTHTVTPSLTPVPTIEGGGGGGGGGGSGGGGDYDCHVDGVSPSNNTIFSPSTDFDANWTVTNTGNTRWEASGMDYVFVGGDLLHQQSGYDLPHNVKSGASIDLGVDMTAPTTPGTYTTTWNLKAGKTYFCTMKLTIRVQ